MLTAPVKERFLGMDALRGLAILGILIVNINAFAFIPEAYPNPAIQSFGAPEDIAAWRFTNIFFTMKFITIFSVMFGAGIAMMMGFATDEDDYRSRKGRHFARMWWLLLFGAIHAFLIWFGDILFAYAFTGLLLGWWGMVRWRVATQLIWGFVFLGLNFFLIWGVFTSLQLAPPEVLAEIVSEGWMLSPDAVAAIQARFELAWPERVVATFGSNLGYVLMMITLYLPRAIGAMLIGMALMKLGFFQGRWPLWSYALGALAVVPGILGSVWATDVLIAQNFAMQLHGTPSVVLDVSAFIQAFGYASIILLIARLPVVEWVARILSLVGRMALSNYILSSLMMAAIFYGPPGRGLIGDMSRADLIPLSAILWLVLIVFSVIWLSLFRFGPLEWVWRSLTSGRPQPLRKA